MKKIVALMLSLLMVLSLAACGAKDNTDEAKTDMEYVKDKGVLVVGITDYAPMDFKEEGNDEWVGFDADMAKAFAKELGVDIEFVEIDWDNKIMELDSKAIDCVWNGMTLTDEVKAGMDCSNAYCNNSQVVIVPADKADKYQTVESLADLNFVVETGSAGQGQAEANKLEFTPVDTQAKALFEVKSKTADAAIIDALMAGAMVGDGTDYADLTYTVSLGDEEFGVGFRRDSDLVKALNDFFAASYADGSMMKCAEDYGVQAAIIPQK